MPAPLWRGGPTPSAPPAASRSTARRGPTSPRREWHASSGWSSTGRISVSGDHVLPHIHAPITFRVVTRSLVLGQDRRMSAAAGRCAKKLGVRRERAVTDEVRDREQEVRDRPLLGELS